MIDDRNRPMQSAGREDLGVSSDGAVSIQRQPVTAHVASLLRTAVRGEVAFVAMQLGLFLAVIKAYRIETRAFRHCFALAVCAWAVHHFLPQRARLPFFAMVSVAGISLAVGTANALIIVAAGLGLIALCHLPGPRWVSLTALLGAAGVLGMIRAGYWNAPNLVALLTVLSSMFMFKMIVYYHDIGKGAPRGFWRSVAYFFMLPNACFPLFPIVDYQAFCRRPDPAKRIELYHTGVRWVFRGLIHLLLLRFINAEFKWDLTDVRSADQMLAYMLVVFSGYLKVSGTFHVIVGMLCLYGFALPETHHRFLLSSSITDFWRRINIYWKDFIQKVVFYPLYFRLKRLGPTSAVVLATLLSMAITWAFHSYQWFWLKGKVLLTPTDITFWSILGILLTINTWTETRFARRRFAARMKRSFGSAALHGLKTSATMTLILCLWSMWTSESFELWFSVLRNAMHCSWTGLGIIVAVLCLPGVISGTEWLKAVPGGRPEPGNATGRRLSLAATPVACLGLLAASHARAQSVMPARLAAVADALGTSRLSRQDRRMLERGYYENLTNVARLSPQLAEMYAQVPPDWEGDQVCRPSGDWLVHEVIPSGTFRFKGAQVHTNRWGMRGGETDLIKPAGVYRIAVIGESHGFGTGVANSELFTTLVAEQINSRRPPGSLRIEMLNLSTPGFGPVRKLGLFEKKALAFDPDAAFFLIMSGQEEFCARDLAQVVRAGFVPPYAALRDCLTRAGVRAEMPQAVAETRLAPHVGEALGWVFSRFGEVCRQHGIVPYVLALPRPEPEETIHSDLDAVADLPRRAGIKVLDMSHAFHGTGDLEQLWIAPWDKHPNARGHRMLAKALVALLDQEGFATARRPEDKAEAREDEPSTSQ